MPASLSRAFATLAAVALRPSLQLLGLLPVGLLSSESTFGPHLSLSCGATLTTLTAPRVFRVSAPLFVLLYAAAGALSCPVHCCSVVLRARIDDDEVESDVRQPWVQPCVDVSVASAGAITSLFDLGPATRRHCGRCDSARRGGSVCLLRSGTAVRGWLSRPYEPSIWLHVSRLPLSSFGTEEAREPVSRAAFSRRCESQCRPMAHSLAFASAFFQQLCRFLGGARPKHVASSSVSVSALRMSIACSSSSSLLIRTRCCASLAASTSP